MSDLTDAQIDAMPAGREMDAEVGRLVMGWRVKHRGLMIRCLMQDGTQQPLPHFSEDIAAAFKVVDHIWQALHLEIVMGGHDDYWWCEFGTPETEQWTSTGMGADRAEAICRAALKATLRSKGQADERR